MRNYIRHPSDIPITIKMEEKGKQQMRMQDLSFGGLAFDSEKPIKRGTLIRIKVTTVDPDFEAEGIVRRCTPEKDHFVIGIEFTQQHDVFVARMVEQVCHIEHYKRQIKRHEGRELTAQEAAKEWIEKFAASFPKFDA